MAQYLVMDHTGHSVIEFDKADPTALAAAEDHFKKLVGRGFTPANADTKKISRTFDPTAEKTLFIPRLRGG